MILNATRYYQILLAQGETILLEYSGNQLMIVAGICSSIGASTIFYPAMSSITTWFFKKRGAAFGIIAAGSSLGGVILPIMVPISNTSLPVALLTSDQVERLIREVGFPWAMRSAAFLILFLMIIANLTITSRMVPSPKPLKLSDFFRPFTELPYDLVCFGCFIFFLGMFLPINYIILEAIHYGMNPKLAQYMVGPIFVLRTIPWQKSLSKVQCHHMPSSLSNATVEEVHP